MGKREDHRRLERLAEMQRLAREQRRDELGQRCAATDARTEAEARSHDEHAAAASALEATFEAPRLCVDRLALAAGRFHFSQADLAEVRHSAEAARAAEGDARARLHRADHRVELIGALARKLRRKRADKREQEAILQSVVVNASGGDRP